MPHCVSLCAVHVSVAVCVFLLYVFQLLRVVLSVCLFLNMWVSLLKFVFVAVCFCRCVCVSGAM